MTLGLSQRRLSGLARLDLDSDAEDLLRNMDAVAEIMLGAEDSFSHADLSDIG